LIDELFITVDFILIRKSLRMKTLANGHVEAAAAAAAAAGSVPPPREPKRKRRTCNKQSV
jgi:hypothetical protein